MLKELPGFLATQTPRWFPRYPTAHAHKAENTSVSPVQQADTAETSPLLWRTADRVTSRKQAKQNISVL